MNATEFMKGQIDCQDGYPAKAGMSKDYYDGYGAEYEKEQLATERTKNEHH